jgi:hypothetical protein
MAIFIFFLEVEMADAEPNACIKCVIFASFSLNYVPAVVCAQGNTAQEKTAKPHTARNGWHVRHRTDGL